jgi:predicted O-methyltransferase YrrM
MADGNFDGASVAGIDEPDAGGLSSMLLRAVPDFEKIDGWLKLKDAELLFAVASSLRSGCIVEVGSYRGRSTVALCAGSMVGSKIPVYAIDPHEHFIGVKGGVFGPSDRRSFFKTMLTTRLANIVRLVNLTSQTAAAGWDKPISLLFIDGDHRYEAVLEDFNAWRPHLVDGAIVIFNDAAGTGTGLVTKDLVAEMVLTPMRTAGRLAIFSFNAVDSEIDPDELVPSGFEPLLTEATGPMPGTRGSRMLSESCYYSKRGNYLYRAIPKCACTVVKTALLTLEGLPLDPNPSRRHSKKLNGFPGTERLTPEEEGDLFAGRTDTFKFVIVRDPYSRLASAYSDKITKGYSKRGHFWIEKITKSAAEQNVKLSDKITFEEFVRVVSAQPFREMDIHWRQQYHVARFDLIKFDFIGRTEAISTDLGYILERLKAPADIMHRAVQPLNISGASMAMWSTVSADVRKAFLKQFAIDFDTLRYPLRTTSVLFSPVNVDRPKPVPFTTQKSNPVAQPSGNDQPIDRPSLPTSEFEDDPGSDDEVVQEDDFAAE